MAKARRRQKFFDVDMPILNKETQLYAYDIKELKGRTINYDLTRILRGKGTLLKLRVEVEEKGESKKAKAHPIEMNIMPYFLKRMMRKGTNYVEDSIKTQTKTHNVIVKPFMITRKKVSRAVRKEVREQAKKEIEDYMKKHTSEEVFDDLLKNKFQKALSAKLKKVYPLSLCEIRFFKAEKPLEKSEKEGSSTEEPEKKEEKGKSEDKKEEK